MILMIIVLLAPLSSWDSSHMSSDEPERVQEELGMRMEESVWVVVVMVGGEGVGEGALVVVEITVWPGGEEGGDGGSPGALVGEVIIVAVIVKKHLVDVTDIMTDRQTDKVL